MSLTNATLGKKYKAIVKSNGRIVKTKTFLNKSHARKWDKELELDQERIEVN